MSDKKLSLQIVSQEKKLLDTDVDMITAPASEGEVTILPDHIPLMTRLIAGELTYQIGNEDHHLVVSKGFLNVAPSNQVTVMVDAAKYVRDISIEKAEQAVKDAQKTMSEATASQRELIMAEASLKQAMLEIRVAQKTKKARI